MKKSMQEMTQEYLAFLANLYEETKTPALNSREGQYMRATLRECFNKFNDIFEIEVDEEYDDE